MCQVHSFLQLCTSGKDDLKAKNEVIVVSYHQTESSAKPHPGGVFVRLTNLYPVIAYPESYFIHAVS